MVSWALGVNYVADYAAKDHSLPTIFGKEDSKGMPIGTGYLNGIVATILVIAAPLIPNQNVFWSFFSLNVIALLLSYTMMFPAFWKLRQQDPNTERPFKIPGGRLFINLITWVPEVLLILAVILTSFPMNLSASELSTKIPILIGTLLTLAIGEIIVRLTEKNHSLKQKNLSFNNKKS